MPASTLPGFTNGQLTDPLAYVRHLVGNRPATQWQSILSGLDPHLSTLGVTRTPTGSSLTFNGKTFDLLGQGGTAWSWQGQSEAASLLGSGGALGRAAGGAPGAPPRPPGGAMSTAARAAAALAANAPGPPEPYTDPVDPASKYQAAVEAALRQRRRGATGGRAGTIVAGFGGGRPSTARATLIGAA